MTNLKVHAGEGRRELAIAHVQEVVMGRACSSADGAEDLVTIRWSPPRGGAKVHAIAFADAGELDQFVDALNNLRAKCWGPR